MSAELLSPAGDFETALAAFAAGADAVYCGLSDFSARAFAQNFSEEQLKLLVRFAHADSRGRKVYVTFNTLVDEADLESAVETLSRLEAIGPDALIVQDIGIAKIVREHFPSLPLHASTQLVAHNLEGVLALRELGFTRAVLSRELSFAEVESIAKKCGDVELEVFVHGALCYSISGLCLYGAMEKGRSGNRGKCPYCCRQQVKDGESSVSYPFSMKDLRIGEGAKKLVDIGVASLKIEGRMKSPLYVSSVTRWYRQILDGKPRAEWQVSENDLETVFSRRTTELGFGDGSHSPIDSESLGHRGTCVGTVKKVTKDREGRSWLRFHTTRALEKHDGLQFDSLTDEGRHFGFGIGEMREAISRRNVFEVAAGADVEILLPERHFVRPGDAVYCSMSNAVKRRFPIPSFRESDFPGNRAIEVTVTISRSSVTASAEGIAASADGAFEPANDPTKTVAAVERAFSKLGGSDYRLDGITVENSDGLFVPSSVLNDLRRTLVHDLDEAFERRRRAKADAALDALSECVSETGGGFAAEGWRSVKIRADQKIPPGSWNEVIIALPFGEMYDFESGIAAFDGGRVRLALPVWNGELSFGRLRSHVKALVRKGYLKWECSDLATLRMLRQLGIDDITADWSLYAFNSAALKQLFDLGVRRFVASPENGEDNLRYLAESGFAVELVEQQTTPLFISHHIPSSGIGDVGEVTVFRRGGLYITTRRQPRQFSLPEGAAKRFDLSWDVPDEEGACS